jgi:cysteinyl-tRNA synthetase
VAIGDREAQGSAGHWLRPAGPSPDDVLPADLTARGLDPLALRLALLRHHHQQPAAVGWDMLAAADEALRAWRRQVAGWALSPSKPMRAQYVADVTGAFDDDLRTPAALAALDALGADGAIPPGSKFEAFAYTDQLLGLDLARDVGR